jgi:hypothetical protein
VFATIAVARERKELTVYPHTHNNELAQAHQAELREEAAQHGLARLSRTTPQVPPQGRGATLVEQCIGAIARLRAMVVA